MALSQSENAEVLPPSLPFLQLSLFLLTTMKVRKFYRSVPMSQLRKVKLTQHQHWLMASSPQRSSVMESRSVGPGWLYMLPPYSQRYDACNELAITIT